MSNAARTIESDPSEVKIISRESIQSLFSILVDGQSQLIGTVKNYSSHEEIKSFLPMESNLSMAWVHLKNGEIHKNHRHSVNSMLIATRGQAQLTGEREAIITEGDIVLIPSNSLHGFVGYDDAGFWGISVQFECDGLFSTPGQEIIQFENSKLCQTLRDLLSRNDALYLDFLRNPLFKKLQDKEYMTPDRKKRFLDFFQIWSNEFQRMMLLRSGLCDDAQFSALFKEHLIDEFNHNGELADSRQDAENVFDPTFEALCRWFPSKITSIDNLEQTVLIHLVVERSAVGFYKHAQPVFGLFSGDHFDKHNELDSIHEKMGVDLLRGLTYKEYNKLAEIQYVGWRMIDGLFNRVAELM